jgi:hypothetical protein
MSRYLLTYSVVVCACVCVGMVACGKSSVFSCAHEEAGKVWTYELADMSDGTRAVTCAIHDGAATYSMTAWYPADPLTTGRSAGECAVSYDTDGNPNHGFYLCKRSGTARAVCTYTDAGSILDGGIVPFGAGECRTYD